MKTVCLFLKSPRLGEAKTRLARDIGAARAAVIYRALVEHQAAERVTYPGAADDLS